MEEKLKTEFKSMSIYCQTHRDPLKCSTSRSSSTTIQHLVGLDLKFSDNSESVNTSTPLLNPEQSTSDTVDICGQSSKMGESSIQKKELKRVSFDSDDTESSNKDTDANLQDSDELNVRQWSVLTHPLPELSSDQQGVSPSLRDCLQEHAFHKLIYYSKKNVSEYRLDIPVSH